MSTIINLARDIATTAHAGVHRADGTPYITHPEAVAAHAERVYDADEATIAACWLHDVVEDTEVTLVDLESFGLPLPVITAVEALTITPDEPYLVAVARAGRHPIARVVKLCDNWHNSHTLDVFPEADRRRRAKKYADARRLLAA